MMLRPGCYPIHAALVRHGWTGNWWITAYSVENHSQLKLTGQVPDSWRFDPHEPFGNYHALQLGSSKETVLGNLGKPQRRVNIDKWEYEYLFVSTRVVMGGRCTLCPEFLVTAYQTPQCQ